MNDLATLLHEDVRATEPTHGLDAMLPVRLGRRRLRARRLATGVAAATIVAIGAVAVPVVTTDGRPAPLERSPQTLAEHVRPVFERTLPDLGAPVTHDDADLSAVVWGDLRRQVGVTVDRASTKPQDEAGDYCSRVVSAGYADCHPHGATDAMVVDEVVAQQVLGTVGPDGNQTYEFADVSVARIDELNPGDRFFARQVRLVRGHLQVLVTERVQAPGLRAALAAFVVPVDDLLEIATDAEVPTLVR